MCLWDSNPAKTRQIVTVPRKIDACDSTPTKAEIAAAAAVAAAAEEPQLRKQQLQQQRWDKYLWS